MIVGVNNFIKYRLDKNKTQTAVINVINRLASFGNCISFLLSMDVSLLWDRKLVFHAEECVGPDNIYSPTMALLVLKICKNVLFTIL